jgi:hypothetical protein
MVAEYTQIGFSFTPLIETVGPQAKERRKVLAQLPEAVAGPYTCCVYTPLEDSKVVKDPQGFPAF